VTCSLRRINLGRGRYRIDHLDDSLAGTPATADNLVHRRGPGATSLGSALITVTQFLALLPPVPVYQIRAAQGLIPATVPYQCCAKQCSLNLIGLFTTLGIFFHWVLET